MVLRLALDWTPNTNHTGFYVALAQGLYGQAGLTVEISTPDQDNYQTTPAKQVAQGGADLAITPSESIISYQTNGVPLVAVAAVLARDASAIVTLSESGIVRPQQLDGRVYGSYNARYEDEIVRQMIRNDGGQGTFAIHKPAQLNLWDALLTEAVDATWIFRPWEGIQAERNGIGLNEFVLGDYGIPYGYSPVLAANRDWAGANADPVRRFMQATTAGFQFAAAHPDEAARLLLETAKHPTLTDAGFLQQSQRMVSAYYLNETGNWGTMDRSIWAQFVNWLETNHLLTDSAGRVNADTLFTNEFLPDVPTPVQA